jgi:predicted transposase YbfD/YdcC
MVMCDAAADGAAFDEAVVFLFHFKDLADPRQCGKVTYPLDEILLLCLLAVLAGAEFFTEIALFGVKKLGFLRRFRPVKDGTPDHGHLGDILAVLDAEQFQRCFVAWVAAVSGVPACVIAIDGKTVRRSAHKGSGKAAIHMVSAFAAGQRLVLGQVKVAENSNEIIAIPKLLDMLAIEGAIVMIDAMRCQRDIAQKIIDKKADYVPALKGNQASLREDVGIFIAEQEAVGFKDSDISQDRTNDGDHERIETRITTVIHDVERLQGRHDWPGLKAVVIVDSSREISGKIEQETRFYITSLVMLAHLIRPAVRSHWAVENSLHWVKWTCSSAMTSAVSGPITRRLISPPSNTWLIICYAKHLGRLPYGAGARPPDGTTTSWPASSGHESFTRFPCGGTGFAIHLLTTLDVKRVMHPVQRAIPIPQAEVVVRRVARWQIFRNVAQLTASAQHKHQTIDHLVNVYRAPAAAVLDPQDQWLDQVPLSVGEVARIAQFVAVIAVAVLARPYRAPPGRHQATNHTSSSRFKLAPLTNLLDSQSHRADI